MTNVKKNMLDALHANGPIATYAEQMMLYEPLIGSWDVNVIDYDTEGSSVENHGEWYFDWILEGRAIQDIWIVPPRQHRTKPAKELTHNRYGTTIRVYNPVIDAWNITWINPVSLAYDRMIGKKDGANIVQEYTDEDGRLNQWIFTEITTNSFHWIGKSSTDEGSTWRIEAEFFAGRQQ